MSGALALRPAALFGIDPSTYHNHWLHGPERTYPETNCYTDLVIELVHARGDEPLAILGSTVRLDFETDQWTFFKPAPEDLEAILGIDIHEIQPYRSLPAQVADTIADGRTLTIEVDAWFLPDTASTSYQREHVKTTIAIESIDLRRERLVYFHNTSLFALDGADYRGLFRIEPGPSADVLLPYVEIVRFADVRPSAEVVRAASAAATRRHLERVGPGNPFDRFGDGVRAVLPELLAGDEAAYHAFAFATVRMAGAGFDLLAAHADWLLGDPGGDVSSALGRIVEGSKLLGFKLARRRPFDPDPTISEMAGAWSEAMGRLDERLPAR